MKIDSKLTSYEVFGLFPSPIYLTKRNSNLDSTEKKEIEDIINEGMLSDFNQLNSISNNSHIFDTKLNDLKEFCKIHIKEYVKKIINPKEKLDFYITQSWLNISRPGESHHSHSHPNSIISGVFYIQSVENDKIHFYDPSNIKNRIEFEVDEFNLWNSKSWFIPIKNNYLILFPSWLTHSVKPNKEATIDRISLAFNTFVKGTLGSREALTELISQ